MVAEWVFGQEKDKNAGIAALFRGFWTHSLTEKTPAGIVRDLCGVALDYIGCQPAAKCKNGIYCRQDLRPWGKLSFAYATEGAPFEG